VGEGGGVCGERERACASEKRERERARERESESERKKESALEVNYSRESSTLVMDMPS
jgi:hypothetical protein